LYSKISWGYFHQAIIQSGAPLLERYTETKSYRDGHALLQRANCNDLVCLKKKSVKQLLEADASSVNHAYYPPEISFFGSLEKGDYHQVPILFGDVTDEVTAYVYSFIPDAIPPSRYRDGIELFARLSGYINNDPWLIDMIAEYFPCQENDCRAYIGKIISDITFNCPVNLIGRHYTDRNIKTYSYLFDHAPTWIHIPKFWGVPHASEIVFVFNTLPPQATEEEFLLSNSMSQDWADFVSKGTVRWETFNEKDGRFVYDVMKNNMTYHWKDEECNEVLPILIQIDKRA